MDGSPGEAERGALPGDRPRRRQKAAAVLLTGFMLLVVIGTSPFAPREIAGSAPALASYATAVLMADVMTAVMLLSIHAARPSRAILVLSLGYLFTGLAAVPWALTFPGIFSQTGLLGAGLQTTAVIAAGRRLVFPSAILAYALMSRAETGRAEIRGWPAVLAGAALTVTAVLGLTWIGIAAADDLPALMSNARLATTAWDVVPSLAALISVIGLAVLWRGRPMCSLDLWLMVVLATQLIEIAMLAGLGSGARFSVGWWAGRAVGLASSSIVLVILTFETVAVYDRLLRAARTERRLREARLASMQALVGAIAHEVNQPLASIIANAGAARRWLDRSQPELGEALAALDRVTSEGHRAADVIDGIRSLLRSGVRRRTPIDMNGLARESLAAIREEARTAGVAIRAELADHLPTVAGDASQLRPALANLLVNGIDAMRTLPGPRVLTVRTAARDGDIVLVGVEDTGAGIPPADAERIFEPFFTTKSGGIGLGLMIARAAVLAHGGALEMRPGDVRGTVFEIRLPARADDPAPSDTDDRAMQAPA